MEKEKDKAPEEQASLLVERILQKIENEDDVSFNNGQSKQKITEILIKTESLFKTFLQDDKEEPIIEFLDSDPEIGEFLTRPRLCLSSSTEYHASTNSILSYMRKQLTQE